MNKLVKLDFIESVAEQYAAQVPTPTQPRKSFGGTVYSD